MSFAKFASSTSPLSYRPPERPKPPRQTPAEPYYPGAVLRVIALPGDAVEYDGFRVGDTFVVLEVEDSIFTGDPSRGDFWYVSDDDGRGLYSAFVECIEE